MFALGDSPFCGFDHGDAFLIGQHCARLLWVGWNGFLLTFLLRSIPLDASDQGVAGTRALGRYVRDHQFVAAIVVLPQKDVIESVARSIHDIDDAWIPIHVVAFAILNMVAKEAIEVARAHIERVVRNDSQGHGVSPLD
jgi:hypothetical protein